jgi:hypothetical protein
MSRNAQANELEAAIRETLKKDHVSFAELSRLPGFKGDYSLSSADFPNIIWWVNMSEGAIDTLTRLRKEGVFHFHPANPLIYLIDGCSLTLPIVKRVVNYKTPHWAPVSLKLGPGPCHERGCPKKGRRPRPSRATDDASSQGAAS